MRYGVNAPMAWMRPMNRPIHSSVAGSPSSGARPPRRGNTVNRKSLNVCKVAPCSDAGRHHRHLCLDQLRHKSMLFQDGGVAPAVRAIELDDNRVALLAADLVHAVFVTVQGQQAAIAKQADAVDGVEDAIGIEALERMLRAAGIVWVHRPIVRPAAKFHRPAAARRVTLAPSVPILKEPYMQLDQPLSEAEFNTLDKFLLSDRTPEDTMTMDTLHGFLTAIAIGPETIMPAEWLPHVWGEDGKNAPKWKNAKEEENIVNLIMRFMNEVLVTFEVAPKEFEPLFCEAEHNGDTLIDGEAWTWGFWEGMELRPGSWNPIWESELAPLMRPIYLLGADEIEEAELKEVDTPVLGHKLALEIEANLPAIYKFWVPLRKAAVQTVRRDEPKVGRNDECPAAAARSSKNAAAPTRLNKEHEKSHFLTQYAGESA